LETLIEMKHIHVSEHDLKRYNLGLITEEAELADLEKHLLSCPACMERSN